MANRLTRVPSGPPPSLGAAAGRLVPLADVFMLLMISRPRTGTLRNTWVTPATLGLSLGLLVIGLAAGCLLVLRASGLGVAVGVVVIPVALGAGAVAVVGIEQRCRS